MHACVYVLLICAMSVRGAGLACMLEGTATAGALTGLDGVAAASGALTGLDGVAAASGALTGVDGEAAAGAVGWVVQGPQKS